MREAELHALIIGAVSKGTGRYGDRLVRLAAEFADPGDRGLDVVDGEVDPWVTRKASSAVRAVEKQLFSPLTHEQQHRLRADLAACVTV